MTNTTEPDTSPGLAGPERIPLVIGVTGHIDLRKEDVESLEKAVTELLGHLRSEFPETPFLVISSLAEGADRLVARVAVDRFGASLHVPLPMPRELYKTDFKDDGGRSVEEFDRLMGVASVTTLPLVSGNTLESIAAAGPARDHQYAQAGAYIVRHCRVLVALWNGKPSDSECGTQAVVRWALEGVPAAYARPPGPLDILETPLVYHVVTPREEDPDTFGERFKWAPHDARSISGARKEALFHDAAIRLNAFNRDVTLYARQAREAIEKHKAWVLFGEIQQRLAQDQRHLLQLYGQADTFAIKYRDASDRTLAALVVLALIAVAAFELYAHIAPGFGGLLVLYPAALFAAIVLHRFATRVLRVQDKHLDYRALAEGLRVQIFWNLAGVDAEAADHYLRNQQNELGWIRDGLRAASLTAVLQQSAERPAERAPFRDLEIVLERWVKNQSSFFDKATGRDDRKARRAHLGITVILWLAVLFAFGVALSHLWIDWRNAHEHGPRSVATVHHALIVVLGLLPAFAAGVGAFSEFMAYSAQAKRYGWMSALFQRAFDRLNVMLNQNDDSAARGLLFELGKEALAENAAWVLLHRERPLEPHVG